VRQLELVRAEAASGELAARITDLVEDPRRRGRYAVLLDGESAGLVSAEIIARLALGVGRAVDEALRAAIAEESLTLATFDRAVAMLALRPHASLELRRKLTRKGESPDRAQAAVDRLLALGALDDAEYARQLARAKVTEKGLSRRRLEQEMYRRGVPREVGDAAIAEVLADETVDASGTLEAIARKKLRTLASLDAPARRRRLYGFLARRGYEPDQVREVMERVLAAES
jgi:regulatory protein